MGTQDCLVLKWNDFPTNILINLQEIRDENDFYDVTLTCDENSFISGHKVILSASSPYFKAILRRTPANQHPTVLMPPGVRFGDLVHLIDFIYNGEIKIANEDVNSFLALAEHLKISGLTEDDKNKHPQSKFTVKSSQKLPPGVQMVKKKGSVAIPVGHHPPTQPSGQKRRKVEAHHGAPYQQVDSSQEIIPEEGEYQEDYEEYDDAQYVQRGSQPHGLPSTSGEIQLTGLLCPQCRMVCQGVDALKDHIARVHGGIHPSSDPPQGQAAQQPSICSFCDKVFKTYKSMIAHQKRVHKILPESSDVKRGRRKTSKLEQFYVEDGMEMEEQGVMYGVPSGGAMRHHGPSDPSKPVGQVHPAPRPLPKMGPGPSGNQQARYQSEEPIRTPPQRKPPQAARAQMHQSYPVDSYQGEIPPKRVQSAGPRMPPAGPRPGPSMPVGQPGQANSGMDLKKLGLKLGGQISITSSESQANAAAAAANRRAMPEAASKFKDEVVQQQQLPHRQGPPARPTYQAASNVIQVKDEPVEEDDYAEDEELEGEEEDFDFPGDEEEGEMDDFGGDEDDDEDDGEVDMGIIG